jgi:hypothetical protein
MEENEELRSKADQLDIRLSVLRGAKDKFYLISRIKSHYELKENASLLSNQRMR